MYTLDELIDLERYPINDLDGRGKELVSECQQSLEDLAVCHLPDFVRPEAVAAICAESEKGKDGTYWVRNNRRAYSWRNPDDYPEGHPVTLGSPNLLGTITTDQFAADSAFVSLFQLRELTRFLRKILRQAELYPVACPYLAANIKVMSEGCKHAWHFDQNDGAVTFLFQHADEGGHFEYVPYLRSDEDENDWALHAEMCEDDIFEWHFAIMGAEGSEFEGGIYHGRILLPPEYPFKPPSFMLLTPSGRFETMTKICLSITQHHPEHWQPSWSVRTALLAVRAFMPTPADGAVGSLEFTVDERRALAARSSCVRQWGGALVPCMCCHVT